MKDELKLDWTTKPVRPNCRHPLAKQHATIQTTNAAWYISVKSQSLIERTLDFEPSALKAEQILPVTSLSSYGSTESTGCSQVSSIGSSARLWEHVPLTTSRCDWAVCWTAGSFCPKDVEDHGTKLEAGKSADSTMLTPNQGRHSSFHVQVSAVD